MARASRFLRLDLSPDARDFEGVALEPGLPLLDQPNANYRIVQRWLGRLVAEPQRSGDTVDFYVCDDQQARLEDVRCDPATADDLRRIRGLEQDLTAIANRLKTIKPTSPLEIRLLEVLQRQFQKLGSAPPDARSQLFKYQRGGAWHLAWAWGYQPKDSVPATTTICTNPSCSLLFLKKSGGSKACPACATAAATGTTKKQRPLRGVTAVVLLVLLLAGLGYSVRDKLFPLPVMDSHPSRVSGAGLFAKPANVTVPVGGRIDFTVVQRDADGTEQDVTNRVVAVIDDPAVLRLDPLGPGGGARRPGKTVAHFFLADKEARATVDVEPPTNPTKIILEPSELTLGVGTTGRLRAWGEFPGKQRVDLTEAAEWDPPAGGGVFCYQGRLEGLFETAVPITARYRADQNAPYLTAQATVKVVDARYKSLELTIKQPTIGAGKVSPLDVALVDESGTRYSVLNSSQLKLWVSPSGLAVVRDDCLEGLYRGRGTLHASFRSLANSAEFQISNDDDAGHLAIHPKNAQLAVGETTELSVTGSVDGAVDYASAAPGIAQIVAGNRVIGRSPGVALVTVSQGDRQGQTRIEVVPAEIKEISFVPDRAVVPVDGSLPVRLVGRSEQQQDIELSPDLLTWERLPTASFADLDVRTLQVTGVRPTGEQPQQAVARFGQLRATLLIDVIAAPVRIELTPAGPIELPVGTVLRLTAWANYGSRRIQLSPERLTWKLDPEVTGLELVPGEGLARAIRPGVESAHVSAMYQGFTSEPVEFKTIELKDSIVLRANRRINMVGQVGRMEASLATTKPDADASLEYATLENVKFTSSDPKILAIDAHSGAYRVMAAGTATITASHPSAASGTAALKCVDAGEVTLELRPATIKLPVDGRQELELVLKTAEDQEAISLMGNEGVELSIGQPKAVKWNPPFLQGLAVAKPFEITASYAGHTARETVEVVSAKSGETPPEIRVVPATASLAPGQSLAPRVEQRISASDDSWQEVVPGRIQWTVPPGVLWTAAAGELRPQLTLTETAAGDVVLEAKYLGAKAELKITPQSGKPGSGPLIVLREPGGDELAVGQRQRYSIGVETDKQRLPAADVLWQPAFESEFALWEPPVLYAKKPGYEQRLTAMVGKQRLVFKTRFVDGSQSPTSEAPPDDAKPASVRIFTDDSRPIAMPLGAQFRDFRVEATFADGRPPLDVTRQATLRVSGENPHNQSVTVDAGGLTAERVGTAKVYAEYNGVRSSESPPIEVAQLVPLSTLEIVPAKIELRPGESMRLMVTGFSGSGAEQKAAGDVAAIAELVWKSANPDIVRVVGPIVTAIKPGKSAISVHSSRASATAEVVVAEAGFGADISTASAVETAGTNELSLSPKSLRLKVGETRWLGSDVTLKRGAADLSQSMDAVSSSPSIVRYNRSNQSLEGVAPGRAVIAITAVDQQFALPVQVVAAADNGQEDGSQPDTDQQGKIVVEPATGQLAVGQTQALRVVFISQAGIRTDRTNSAQFESSDPAILSVTGNQVAAAAVGQAQILARLPGIKEPGTAFFTASDDAITAIQVTPPEMKMGIGEERQLRIVGVGPAGRRELAHHQDLKVTVSGPSPQAIQIRDARHVRAVSAGTATIEVHWRDLAAEPIAVDVSGEPLSGLRIEPVQAVVDAGQRASFRIYARRGKRETALSPEDGVSLRLSDSRVAKIDGDFSAMGIRPGTTEVSCELGSQTAVAKLTVAPTTTSEPAPPAKAKSLRFIPDHLALEVGLPAARVRVVKVMADGAEEALDRAADVKFSDPDIAEASWTPWGLVFTAKKAGRTEASATLDGLVTRLPLAISVADSAGSRPGHPLAYLRIHPDPLELTIGGSAEFHSVQVMPAGGGTPLDVDYRIETQNAKIVAVEGKTLRGIAPGRTAVTISALAASGAPRNLDATVTVEVAGGGDEATARSELVLTGPAQTSVGAEVKYRALSVSGGRRVDVTYDATTLVLDQDQLESADLQPGCVLLARRPGVINVRARHNDQISNVLSLRIDGDSKNFVRLELEIERRPLVVGEKRGYELWGYTAEGTRQDLTPKLVGPPADAAHDQPRVVIRNLDSADKTIIVNAPPRLVAKAIGKFQIAAAIGKDLHSEILTLEILAPQANSNSNAELTALPQALTLRVGERTPEIAVHARDVAGGGSRPVDVQWTSQDEAVASPDPQNPGRFLCRRIGKTVLNGAWGGQAVSVALNVLRDQFDRVRLEPRAVWKSAGEFQVVANIEGTGRDGREYRIVDSRNPGGGDWKTATVDGDSVKVELTSPVLQHGPPGTVYRLTIECRDQRNPAVERYPLSFKIAQGTVERQDGADAGNSN